MRGMRYQPQGRLRINTRNSLASGLASVLTPSSSTRTPIGGARIDAGPAGVGFTSGANNRWLVSNTGGVSGGETWTILAVLQSVETSPNTSAGRTIYVERPTASQIIKLGLGDGSTTSAALIVRNAAGTNLMVLRGTSNVKNATAAPRVIVGVRAAANSHSLYVNGRFESSSGTNASGSWAPSAAHIAGDPQDLSASLTTASVPLVLCWNRALSPDEISAVSANPWQLFAAPEVEGEAQEVAAPTEITGSASTALTGLSIYSSGAVTNGGAMSSQLGGDQSSLAGSVAEQPSGSFSSALTGVSFSAVGALLATGAMSSNLAGVSAVFSGNVAFPASGDMAAPLEDARMNAYGYQGDAPPVPENRRYRPRILRRHFTN